ncbi:MAG: colanic acid exporter [Firmicutes bacterium ADurb.Bin419]|nr:MAG: colanic acid exporter [Firmicutes bacterium ADurb.Bin419]
MKRILTSIRQKQSSMLNNVLKISSGTMLGQIISIATLPIFARIFGAEVIGDWSLFTSVTIIVNTFSDLGLSNAVMIEETEDDTKKLFSIITTLVMMFSLFIGCSFFVFYSFVPSEVGISATFYGVFIAILVFTQQQIQLSYSWLNRKKEYNVLMKNPIINNLSAAIIAIPLGLLGYKQYGYYIGLISGQIITLLHMRRNLPRVFLNFSIKDHKTVFLKHKEFCIYQMPTNIVAQFKNEAPILFIRTLFGAELLGYYSVSVKILKIPITFLANSIGKVYYQQIAEMTKNKQDIGEFTIRNIERATKIAIIPMIILLSLSDLVCKVFLGSDFIVAGNITRIVSYNSFFIFLMMSTQGLAIVLHKQKYALISAVIQLIGYAVGLAIGKFCFDSIYIGCFIMTFIFCIVQIVYFSKLFKVINISVHRYLKSVVVSLIVIFAGSVAIRILSNLLGIVHGI